MSAEPSRSTFPRKRRVARAALVLGLAALVLAFVWSWPRARAGSDAPPLVLVLVDASRHTSQARLDWPGAVERELERARREAAEAGAELAVISFAAGAVLEHAPARPAELDARALSARLPRRGRSASGSELAAALDLAENVRRARGAVRGRIVVVGDASRTGADPAARLARFRDEGFASERRAPGPPDVRAVALGDLELPRALHAGDGLVVRVSVHARPALSVRLVARAQWPGGRVDRAATVAPPPGAPADADGWVSWSARLDFGAVGPGRVSVGLAAGLDAAGAEGRIQLPEPDGRTPIRDDQACGTVVVGDAPVVLLAGEPGPALDALLSGLSAGLPAAGHSRPERVPFEDLARRLADADVLVTLDAPPSRLPARELGAFVRGGGGWLALAGEATRAAFAGERGALELLPLVPPKAAPPPRDLVFLVDGSGSMEGDVQTALLGALADLLALLAPGEALEFRWFAGELGPPLRHERQTDAEARAAFAATLLAEHPPGGPTHLLASLERLLAERTSGRDALVFVLSDGQESETDGAPARAHALGERARSARARLVPVATGRDVNAALLAAFLAPGESLERAGALGDPTARARLARLLERELSSARAAPLGEHRVLAVGGVVEHDLGGGVARSVLERQRELLAAPWPGVATYLLADAAPAAATLWRSETGDALLALQAVGLGRSAACAFAPGADAPGWSAAGPAALLAPLVQALAAGRARTGLGLRLCDGWLVLEGDGTRMLPARVTAKIGGAGDPRDLEAGGAPELTARAAPREIVFEPDLAPGGDGGTRSAAWPEGFEPDSVRATVELALDPPRTLFVELPRSPDSRWPRRTWSPAEGTASTAPGAAVGADPRALPALIAGILLLALAGGLGLGTALARGRSA